MAWVDYSTLIWVIEKQELQLWWDCDEFRWLWGDEFKGLGCFDYEICFGKGSISVVQIYCGLLV